MWKRIRRKVTEKTQQIISESIRTGKRKQRGQEQEDIRGSSEIEQVRGRREEQNKAEENILHLWKRIQRKVTEKNGANHIRMDKNRQKKTEETRVRGYKRMQRVRGSREEQNNAEENILHQS